MARASGKKLRFDRIGYWSEIKLDIVKEYAKAYSTIFSAKRQAKFHHVYIDAFAGAGVHLSKTRDEEIPGSPLNALNVNPPFREYHFIDLDGTKVNHLKKLVGDRSDVHIHKGDCNQILLDVVFPKVRYEDYRRGLCLLDPYGLHLSWEVIQAAGHTKTIDLFLNFPVADMNRNVFWRNAEGVDASDVARMNAFWGDASWRKVVYETVPTLFGEEEEKTGNKAVAAAFRKRLIDVAGFPFVPDPLPMRNTRGAVVYYLFFGSQNKAAQKIATELFKKYRERGMRK